MADGKIRIETIIDNTPAEKDFKELIDLAGDAAEVVSEEMRDAVEDLAIEYNKLVAKEGTLYEQAMKRARVLKDMKETQAKLASSWSVTDKQKATEMTPDINLAQAQYNELMAKVDEVVLKQMRAKDEASKLAGKIRDSAEEISKASGVTEVLASRMSGVKHRAGDLTESFALTGKLKQASAAADKLKSALGYTLKKHLEGSVKFVKMLASGIKSAIIPAKKLNREMDMSNSITKGIRKLAKYGLALFSIRSIYSMLSRASSAWLNSTNEGAQQLKANIDYMWMAIGNALAPVLEFVVSLVYKLLSMVNALLMTFFGINIFAGNLASSSSTAAGNLGDAVKEAKELKKQMAGFDEMNVLSKQETDSGSSDGGGAYAPDFDPNMTNKFSDALDGLIAKLEWFWKPFVNAWNNEGQAVMDAAMFAFDEMKGLVKEIGISFKEVWSNGTGERTLSLSLRILTNILNTIGEIAKSFRKAWKEAGLGTAIMQNSSDILNLFLEGVDEIGKSFLRVWKQYGDSFAKSILTSFNSILKLIKSIEIAWLNVWTSGSGDELLSNILFIFQDIVDIVGTMAGLLEEAWNKNAIGESILQGVIDTINVLLTFIHAVGTTIQEVLEKYAQPAIDAILLGVDSLISIFKTMAEAIIFIWDNGGAYLFEQMVRLGMKIIEIAGWIYNEFVAPFLKWFIEFLAPAVAFVATAIGLLIDIIVNLIEWFMDLRNKGTQAWDSIKGVWDKAANWFKTTVTEPIGRFFSNMWEGVKTASANAWTWILGLFAKGGQIFHGVTDGIVNMFVKVVNAIIDGINAVVSLPFNGINGILNGIRGFDIPLIGQPFKGLWGHNPIGVPQVPKIKLAKGGIINRPAQAIIGEAGKEAVLPLQNNTEWMDMLAEKIAVLIDGVDSDDVIEIYLDSEKIWRVLRKKQKKKEFALNGG